MSHVSLYLIAAEGTDLVKIGIAADPDGRLKSLQTASPHRLSVFYAANFPTRAAAMKMERLMHDALSPTRMTGEWFDVGAKHALYFMGVLGGAADAEFTASEIRSVFEEECAP